MKLAKYARVWIGISSNGIASPIVFIGTMRMAKKPGEESRSAKKLFFGPALKEEGGPGQTARPYNNLVSTSPLILFGVFNK
jgi:hypothetical protein